MEEAEDLTVFPTRACTVTILETSTLTYLVTLLILQLRLNARVFSPAFFLFDLVIKWHEA